jgi:acyl carrier protein
VPQQTELEGTVRRVAADVLGVPVGELNRESSPETIITWDSIAHLNLMVALEEELGVQFDPDDLETMTSVGAIVETSDRYLRDAGAA